MDDLPVPGIDESPSISSVLKPPRPRIPLKELVLAANDEDNTAARKRRVSFANVNKIKEFSAGAESMVVCHTPAYEEPFSLSSDSSCPSGADGWTPAKSVLQSSMQSAFPSAQKESDCQQPLFNPRMSGFGLTENVVLTSSTSPNVMDLTNCNRGSLRNSTRFSLGMDFTEVIRSSLNDSGEYLDLSKGSAYQPYQPHLYQTNLNESDGMLADDSDALEFTDAVIDPRFSLASRYSVSNVNTTRNIYSVNNTRYSLNGMDLTKAAMSPASSVGRRSTRYSLSSMDLTEAVGNDCSGLEFTEVISEPKIVATRYSVNDMDLTEAITRDDLTRLTLTSGDKLEGSLTSGSSMDLTKPVFEVHQSYNAQASAVPDNVDVIEPMGSRPSTCYSANMDSLELNDSSCETDDTPTTQTFNGTQPPPTNISLTSGKHLISQEVFNVKKSKSEIVDIGTFDVHEVKNNSLVCNNIQDSNQKSVAETSTEQLETSVCSISRETLVHDLKPDHTQKDNNISINIVTTPIRNEDETKLNPSERSVSVKDSEVEITKTNNECLNIEEPSLCHAKTDHKQENNSCNENKVTLKTNEMIEEEYITFVNDESMDLSEPLVLSYLPVSRNSLNPDNVGKIRKDESGNKILEMDVSVLSPDKKPSLEEDPLLNGSLKQNTSSNDGGVVCKLFSSKTASQIELNNEDMMDVSFSETDSVKHVEDCTNRYNEQHCDTSLNDTEYCKGNKCASTLEISKEFVITEKEQQKENNSEDIINEIIHKTDNEKSCDETIDESTKQKDSSINVTNSSDLILNVSANSTLFGKNITMTRGGTSQNRTIPHDSTFETSQNESIRVNESKTESSMPLIQRIEKLQKTVDISGDDSQDGDILCASYKGGKRSFEVALEPENDTEESPVKQICLMNDIQLPHSECLDTSTSFLMDKSAELHNSDHSVHQSETNKSTNNGTNLTQSAVVDLNIERKDLSQNDHVNIKTRISIEQTCSHNDYRNSFNVDLSTNYDISRLHSHNEKENFSRTEQIDDMPTISGSQQKKISLKPIYDRPVSQSCGQSLFLHNSLSNCIQSLTSHDLKSNQLSNTPAVTLKTTDIYRQERSVRKLIEGTFTYNLIPRWIEMQFSVDPSGIVFNRSFKLVCTEEERAVGEYMLKQLSGLPEEKISLTSVSEEPRDTFLLHLPKNLSVICKYYDGSLKGDVLSLDIVSCKQRFWTVVDVNIKYPKYLSAEDITISEQRIGELKLSVVREMFASIHSGNDQLLNFAKALKKLK